MKKSVAYFMQISSSLALVLLSFQTVYGMTEITGTVTEKLADSVKVAFEPHKTVSPKVGDKVDFSKDFQGIRVGAGIGKVTKVDGKTVWVKTGDDRPKPKMNAVIHASTLELIGTISGIKDDMLSIEMSTGDLPQSEDPVLIVREVDGKMLEVGKAWVYGTRKDSRRITAKIIRGKPAIGMKVSIPHEQYRLDRELFNAMSEARMSFQVEPVERVRQAIRSGADVNKIWFDDNSHPLILAVEWFSSYEKFSIDIVLDIIKAGASIEAMETSLGIAAHNGNVELIKIFLQSGADVNARMSSIKEVNGYRDPSSGATALIITAAQNEFGIVRMLLESGADVNSTNDWGETALFFAEKREDARLLIDAGAGVSVVNKHGETPLFHLASVSPFSSQEVMPGEAVDELIKAGIDVNTVNKEGLTALFFADAESTRLLIEAGAKVNHRGKDGLTPLFINSSENISRLAMLLNAGAEINAKTTAAIPADELLAGDSFPAGGTALMRASAGLDLLAARILILVGADVAAKNDRGQTALMLAKQKEREGITKMQNDEENLTKALKEQGSGVNQEYIDYRSEENQIRREDIEEFIRILQDDNPAEAVRMSMEADLLKAIGKKQNDYAKLLLRHGVNPNAKNQKNQTALWQAMFKRNFKVIPAIIAAGGNVNQTFFGISPLLGAAAEGDKSMVEILVRASAEINYKYTGEDLEKAGMTPLMVAASEGHKEVVSQLLTSGADPNITDKQERKAIDHAREKGHADVVRLLTSAR